MFNEYVFKENKKLRCGYTTGTCAAAASKAAARMLLFGAALDTITIGTPKGITLNLKVEEITMEPDFVTCAIRKDSGDDYDVTNGILVYSTVKKSTKAGINVDGGPGVGRVTKQGLDQEVGQAAINRVPRRMIADAVWEVCEEAEYEGGLDVIISIPEGEEIARKTFNPRLGIQGGLSILGTSGIVEPMSETALINTIRTEIRMLSANGNKSIIVTPGNYGEDFLNNTLKLDRNKMVKCSNFVGETIDMAYEFSLTGMLLVGHIGKFVKLGSGIMNTHSKMADGRMEILVSCGLLAGAERILLKAILNCVTTDEALDLLNKAGLLKAVMDILIDKIEYHVEHRAYPGLDVGVILYSNTYGLLGKTKKAEELAEKLII